MLIGRLEVTVCKDWQWGYLRGICQCLFLEIGPLSFTWFAKECIEGLKKEGE